jgi:hypothetical protein
MAWVEALLLCEWELGLLVLKLDTGRGRPQGNGGCLTCKRWVGRQPSSVTSALQELAPAGVSFAAQATPPVGATTAEPDTQVLPSSQGTPSVLSRRLRRLPSHVSLGCPAERTDDSTPILQLLDQMPVMAEHLTGITGVTEDATPARNASTKSRGKKGSKGKGSAEDKDADMAEEVKELREEEAEKEHEEKEKFDEAKATQGNEMASSQARSARLWVREASRWGWRRLPDGVHCTLRPSCSLVSLFLVRRGPLRRRSRQSPSSWSRWG